MPLTSVEKDLERHTLKVVAEYAAPVERVWQLWADARQLERWWGPPTWPATVVEHELRPGGRVSYFMTGPDGGRSGGWWKVLAVEAPRRLEVEDGFADESGQPNTALPTVKMQVALTERPGGGTIMTVVSTYATREAMEQILAMGMEEGMRAAMGQIEGVLAG